MSTMTAERVTVPVQPSSKERMGEELASRSEQRTLRDRVMAAPRRLRDWLMSVLKWSRVDRVTDRVNPAYQRAKALIVKVTGPIRVIGPFYIVGALLTAQGGRRLLRSTLGTAYQVVSAPVRWIGRGLSWLSHRLGMGKVADRIESRYDQATSWVTVRFDAAMDWFDKREHHGGMRWARPFFQGGIATRLIRRYAPVNLRTPLYIANLFVPIFGVGEKGTESKLSLVKEMGEQAEKQIRRTDKKAQTEADAKAEDKAAEPAAPVEPTSPAAQSGPAEAIETIAGVIVGTGKGVRLQRVTRVDGTVFYRYGGREYPESELPGHIRLADATASTEPNPPAPNRAARRAEEQQQKREDKAKAKSDTAAQSA